MFRRRRIKKLKRGKKMDAESSEVEGMTTSESDRKFKEIVK